MKMRTTQYQLQGTRGPFIFKSSSHIVLSKLSFFLVGRYEPDIEMIIRMFFEEIFAGANSRWPEGLRRVPVDPTGNQWRGQRVAIVLHGGLEDISVAFVKFLIFIISAAFPNRTDRMDDIFSL